MPASLANRGNASRRRISSGSSAERSKNRSMPGAAGVNANRNRVGPSPALCQVCATPLGMNTNEPAGTSWRAFSNLKSRRPSTT
jgi:hypothetical protein